MPEFNGTIEVKENPTSSWETFSHTFEKSGDVKESGYFDLKFSQRAEGGYYRATFNLRAPYEFQSNFMNNALGREARIYGNDGTLAWEGYIHAMEYNAGRAVYKIDLGELANAVWMRYRVRGASTTSRSTVQTDADSISKFGRKEFILSGGELENSDIADYAAQQYLNLHKWPSPSPVRLDPEAELSEYPTVGVVCRGWFDTLDWCTYNQTGDTDAQGASGQITDIIADTDVSQFVANQTIDPNSISVGKEYDADRRGGAIIKDIARLGDQNNNRWVASMAEDREFIYASAAPPVEVD
jgi:hypothetical protein